MKKIVRSRWFRFGIFAVEATGVIVIGIVVYLGQFFYTPDLSYLADEDPAPTAFMIHRREAAAAQGKRLDINRQWVPYHRISPVLRKAVVLTEDGLFWDHEGFDVRAIKAAIETDLREGRPKFGGSTISQQLTKNLFLSPSKNPFRKLKEAILTWRLERTISKERILELYLNSIEWGDGIFGVEAASKHYFGVSAAYLTLEQAARLAVVIPNPRKLKADGDGAYVIRRARWVQKVLIRQDPSLAQPRPQPTPAPKPVESSVEVAEAEPDDPWFNWW